MSRNLTVLLCVLILGITVNLPAAFSIVQTEITVKKVKKLARKQAKKLDKKLIKNNFPVDDIADGAVTLEKLDPSVSPGGVLPSGVTIRGVFSTSIVTNAMGEYLLGNGTTFGGYRLPSRPAVHVINTGGPSTLECPGSAAVPEAASGHACLYLTLAFSPFLGVEVVVLDPIPEQ